MGAGPLGLLLALFLALAGITVELDTNPRASHCLPESCYEFERAGVLDEIRIKGFDPITKSHEADYIVGCDGANSIVRRNLFGDMVFPGFTWDKQIVATSMYYDFSPFGYDDSQFFIHPQHWHMAAKIQADGLHRVTYGEIGGLNF